jgi:hypothetical protein
MIRSRRAGLKCVTHEPRRRWRALWRRECRCGLAAWPCPVMVMLIRQARNQLITRDAEKSDWNGPTRNLPLAPLLTRGQAARSRQSGHW